MLSISTLEQMLAESDSKYFAKIDSSKIRMAIVNTLQLLPLHCRGERMDADLYNLRDDLNEMKMGRKSKFHDLPDKVIEVLVKRVKETLESDHL